MSGNEVNIYTDGGYAGGHGGWGYAVYEVACNGEELPSEKLIYEAAGGGGEAPTNNRAELMGFAESIKWCENNNNFNATFLLDSQYVIQGFNDYIERWETKNWVTGNGKIVKNQDLWAGILDKKKELRKKGISLKLAKVKGHSGNKGNDRADQMATRGIALSSLKQPDYHSGDIQEEFAAIKKTKPTTSHPLICYPKLLHVTGTKHIRDALLKDTGFGAIYYIQNYPEPNKKNDEDAKLRPDDYNGKRGGANTYGVVFLKEPDYYIEKILSIQDASVMDDYQIPAAVHLKKLYDKATIAEINKSDGCLINVDGSIRVWGSNPITFLFDHTLKTGTSLERLTELRQLMQSMNDPDFFVEDVTDRFIEYDAKGKPKVLKEMNSSVKRIMWKPEGLNTKTEFPINLGVDLPTRNDISALAKVSDKLTIKIVRYGTDVNCFRHFQVIETDDAVAAYYAPDGSFKIFS